MGLDFLRVHASWSEILAPFLSTIEEIIASVQSTELAPPKEKVLRAFQGDLEKVRVVIFGQDPYPTRGFATGLAFSIPESAHPIPASLRNIFRELQSDLGIRAPSHGSLQGWSDKGVLLLNRVLTTEIGKSGAHSAIGWQIITDAIARELGRRGVVAILWGKSAAELAVHFHQPIVGVHPSPLSAHRGFFGSQPFSRANQALMERGKTPIDWSL